MAVSDISARIRVLVGNSVFEDATVTLRGLRLFVEFDADDLDDIEINLAVLGLERAGEAGQ